MSLRNVQENVLFGKLEKKDKDSFVVVYDRYLGDIYRFILFKVSDDELAKDITSTVFLKAWEYVRDGQLTSYKTVRGLLYKIARNAVIDHYRKQANESRVDLDDEAVQQLPASDRDHPARQLEISDDHRALIEKLVLLKDEYREAITLRYVNELSVGEIAAILDKSHGTVRVLLHRAMNALKEVMRPE
jgi:RNA polymerase sigma-70 factor, ECF subfamily